MGKKIIVLLFGILLIGSNLYAGDLNVSGNVGIGTTSPGEALSVSYGANKDISIGSATNNKAFFSLYNDALSISVNRRVSDGIFTNTNLTSAAINLYTLNNDSYISFLTGAANNVIGTERVRIDKQGYLGIGNNAPTRLLDVVGAGYNNVGTLYTNVSFRQDLTNYRGVAFGYDTSGQIGVITPTGGTTNQLAFWTYNNSVWGERVRITGEGNIGIGTTSPGYKLDVQGGQINASGGLCISGSCKTDWSQVGGSQWTTSGSNIYYNTGYVGIGTANPGGHLQIESVDAGTQLRIANTSSGGRTWIFYSQAGSGNLHVWENGAPTTRLLIQGGTGNIGIGTPSPSYTLTVNGSSWTSSGAWSGSDIRWKKNIMPLNATLDKILKLKGVNYEWKKDEFKAINFSDGKQIGLIAQDVEKVFPELVKTDDEGYKAISYERLSVLLMKAVQEIAAGLDITEAGSSSPSIKSTYKGNEAALAIDKNGNLGVGTDNPSSRLDVKGDIKTSGGISAASIASSGSITAHGNIVQSSPDLNNYGISFERTDEDTKYHAWTFWHANTQNNTKNSLEIWEYKANEKSDACTAQDSSCYPRLVIKEGGNVGIGTAEPQSKLEVNGGDIRITGGSIIDDGTTLNVPDYVFERGYKIKSINELSAFVESNKHLPGLPDASSKTEWSKISLQERDMKLLEKIEELTVYIIKQQREIETLRAEMKKMKE